MEFTVRNANDLLSEGLWKLNTCGVKSESRNGPVIRIMEPVIVTVERPQERVLFFEGRDAPHMFHLMESIWILAGRRDVGFLQYFNSKIGQFSDDGKTFNAAYGFRARRHFGHDQLLEVIETLRTDPNSRQAVVQLWDAADLMKQTKDKCCNTQLIFSVDEGKVNLTINTRSNDFWWGNAGANIVHFSFLLEFVASSIDIPIGKMRTLINNLHFYTELYDANRYLISPPDPVTYDAYSNGIVPRDIMDSSNANTFLRDCEMFCENPFEPQNYYHDFFNEVAHPVAMITKTRKEKTGDGLYWAHRVAANDWELACRQWILRREMAK